MLLPTKRRAAVEPEAAKPVTFTDFDPILTSMRRRLIEFAAQEESLLTQILLEQPNYRPPAMGQIPGPAQYVKPKQLTPTELAARELLNGFAPELPPEPPPAQKIELFNNPGNRKAIELQRQLEAVRLARETLNHEVVKRVASASRLYGAEVATAYAERVQGLTDALIAFASAYRQHEQFTTDLRLQGMQTVFLPAVNTAQLQGALEAADRVVQDAAASGHVDVREAFAAAATPLPLSDYDAPYADVKQRLTEAQKHFEDVKKTAGTRVVRRKRSADDQHAGL